MVGKLENDLEQVKADLAQPPPEPGSRKGAKKVVKKVTKVEKKGAAAKAAKPSNGAAESEEGKVTLATLAGEAGITTAGARRKLRAAELERTGRWSWEEGSKALSAARKALGLDA